MPTPATATATRRALPASCAAEVAPMYKDRCYAVRPLGTEAWRGLDLAARESDPQVVWIGVSEHRLDELVDYLAEHDAGGVQFVLETVDPGTVGYCPIEPLTW